MEPQFTVRQVRVLAVVSLVVALSRLLALARSPWDWDEMLFSHALRDYDVRLHHPHPPGFPLFVGLAKLARLMVDSDFRALQVVTMTAAMLLFPLVVLLAREIGFTFQTAMSGAALLLFLPNVWFYGGTGFSDIPSLTLSVAAAWLLLRGRGSGRALLVGALLAGGATAIRSQNVVMVAAPFLIGIASQWRKRWLVLASGAIAALSGGVPYLVAAVASGSIGEFLRASRHHRDYVMAHDSILAQQAGKLWIHLGDVLVRSVPYLALSYAVALLMVIGTIAAIRRRDNRALLLASIFLPVLVLVWLLLDRRGFSRLSLGYLPMFPLLAAYGTEALFAHRRRGGTYAWLLIALLIFVSLQWTSPALTIVRESLSPPIAAVEYVQRTVPPGPLHVAFAMGPFADYYLSSYVQIPVFDGEGIALTGRPELVLAEGMMGTPLVAFERRREGPLWKTARHRYFRAFVGRLQEAELGEGWYAPELTREGVTRWMAQEGEIEVRGVDGPARLEIDVEPPSGGGPGTRELVVYAGDREVARSPLAEGRNIFRFVVPAELARTERVTLRLWTSAVLDPSESDGRSLGLRVRRISWGKAKG